MARRLFSTQIVDSDAFLDMPISAQGLYFHLGMRADDDGFIDSVKKTIKICGSSNKDLDILAKKRFILVFKSEIVVIKHWRIHNKIRKDRYKKTKYTDEKNSLKIKTNGAYTEKDKSGTHSGNQMATKWQPKLSKGKLSKGKLILTDKKTFVGNDIELLTSYFIKLTKSKERRSRYYRAAGEILTLCDNSLEKSKDQIMKTKEWAEARKLKWGMETVVKRYMYFPEWEEVKTYYQEIIKTEEPEETSGKIALIILTLCNNSLELAKREILKINQWIRDKEKTASHIIQALVEIGNFDNTKVYQELLKYKLFA